MLLKTIASAAFFSQCGDELFVAVVIVVPPFFFLLDLKVLSDCLDHNWPGLFGPGHRPIW